jgi:hypothetical protein
MSRKIGIDQNSQQRIISGARVAFDPRTTAEVCDTRSAKNGVADEQWLRKAAWEDRERNKRRVAAE